MTARPVKRSLTLRGHRTSVSLEDAFWHEFRRIAKARNLPLNELAARIDTTRGDVGLASAIRVFVLQTVTAQCAPPKDAPDEKPYLPAGPETSGRP